MELSDYAQALGAAQRLVPNWRQGDMQEAELAQARMQPQLIQAQIARSQAQTQQEAQKAQYEQQRRTAFASGLSGLGAKPTPDKLYQLSAQFPEFATQIQGAAKGIGTEDSAKIVRNLAPVQSLIQNGKYDLAAAEVKRHIDADKAAGIEPDEHDTELYGMLTSGDPEQAKSAGGIVYGLLAALNPETAAANLAKVNADKNKVVSAGGALVDENGKELYRASSKPEYRTIKNADGSESIVQVGGGDPVSGGGAAGTRGDVSRLINTDAGGGYVPEGVKTLGQFVGFGKDLNRRGAKSSSAGTYQINGSTMAEFAPKALGADWKQAPFNADTQERVGEAIFNWAKTQNNPAAALRGRWVSLDPSTAARLVQGSWQQARGTIAQGETGGGARSSAAAGSPSSQVVFTSQGAGGGDDSTTGEAFLASLPAGRRNLLKNISEGRAAPPKPGSKFGEKLAEDLARAYPDADTTQFATRQQAMKAFSSGTQGNTVRSLNVAIDHLGVLHDAALALHNGNTPLFNKLSQRFQKETGSPLPSNAKAIAGIVGDEVTKAVVGSAGALADREDIKSTLNTAGSPAQIMGITRSYISLMAGQAKGLQQQYEQATGNKDFGRFLNHTTAKQLGISRGAATKNAPGPVAAPKGGKLVGTYQGRQVFQLSDGRRVVAK